MILVACKRCNRTFAYGDRDEADPLCPDCDKGPFNKWFVKVSTADELMTDGGQVESGVEQFDHPHADGVTRGTVLEYDGWQWGVVTEVAADEDPTRVGFVLLDELGDGIVPVLEDACGCAEHYDAVKAYRWSEHEYWTDAEYLQADIWETLGPIHPQERDGNDRSVETGTDRSEDGGSQ